MQGSHTDDTGRFMRAIAALSDETEELSEFGRLLAIEKGGVAQAILNEIDETVLRRKLVFRTSVGAELSLDVVERRIASVLALGGRATSNDTEVVGHPLSRDDAGPVSALIARFSADAESVHARAELPDEAVPAEFSGLSIQDLKTEFEMYTTVELPPDLIGLLEASKQHAIAICSFANDEILFSWGNVDACHDLQHIDRISCNQEENSRFVTLLSGGFRDNCAVVLAHNNDTVTVALCARDQLEVCFAVWQRGLTEQL